MKKFYRCKAFGRLALSLLLGMPLGAFAQQFGQQANQEEKELAPVSRTYAITNATVIQGPGRKIEQGTVVIKDGLIQSVAKNAAIPPEAIIIKGDSLFVYAGFIDGLSRVGVPKPKDENRERPKDPGNPAPDAAGITPEKDVRSVLSPQDKSIEELRALGFTTAQVVPYGTMLPGSASVVFLNGKTTDAMIVSSKSAIYSELQGGQRVYPSTVIGVMAKFRELYRQAVQAKNYETLYAANRTGLSRPASDHVLEAFYPVIDKRIPVVFKAERYLDTQRTLTLQQDLGFSLVIADVKEGWESINDIKSSGTKVFLSLDLPEDKKDDKKDAKDKKPEPKKEEETTLTKAEKEALEKRKADALAQYTGQAATFQKAGVTFGFSTLSAKTADIRANLRRMITAGLSEDQALAALTTNPAQLLGMSDRLGSIDNGKIANLVLSNKPYFNEKSQVRYVFVDGTMYKIESKDAAKNDAGSEITGTWTVTTQMADIKSEETLTIRKEGKNFSGSISGGKLKEAIALETVEVNGKSLKYSYTVPEGGQSYKVSVEATIDGKSFKGTSQVGTTGTFNVEGKKEPNR